MRISDWSSDVCSSDLRVHAAPRLPGRKATACTLFPRRQTKEPASDRATPNSCLPLARPARSQPRRLGIAAGLPRSLRQLGEPFPTARIAARPKREKIGAADAAMNAGPRDREPAPIEKAHQILPGDAEE